MSILLWKTDESASVIGTHGDGRALPKAYVFYLFFKKDVVRNTKSKDNNWENNIDDRK